MNHVQLLEYHCIPTRVFRDRLQALAEIRELSPEGHLISFGHEWIDVTEKTKEELLEWLGGYDA